MDEIDNRINQANGRLKSAEIKVTIGRFGGRLWLRATFPPKPGTKQGKPSQQRLYLGIPASIAGMKVAENQARMVGAQLAASQFDWTPYLKTPQQETQTVAEWLELFERDYFSKRDRNFKTETTWEGDYVKIFRLLPPDQALTVELMEEVIYQVRADTRTRQRACTAIGALADFAKLDFDPSPLAGNYSPRQVSPRDLPDDITIAEWFYKLKNPAWRWVFGMMATYGIRNHEVFKLDFDQLRQGGKVASVLPDTKTGERRVWACYPEWWEEFKLTNVQLPTINLNRSNEKIGRAVTKYFRDTAKLPFTPYTLRHCWAVRTMEFGLPVELAAKQMGHSVIVHCDTYHHWITDRHHQRVYDLLMMRSDRPKAPTVLQPLD